jgi:prolyl 4-hydroxylase
VILNRTLPYPISNLANSDDKFKPSMLYSNDRRYAAKTDPTFRSSLTATLDSQELVRCVEDRARSVPWYDSPKGLIKSLVVQRYGVSHQYKSHYDWFPDGPYIEDNIEPRDEKWCEFIDCDEPWDAGVTFKPITGNAVFWKNLKEDGQGHQKTLHAGLPVTSGMKTGLNIWTWVKNKNWKLEV